MTYIPLNTEHSNCWISGFPRAGFDQIVQILEDKPVRAAFIRTQNSSTRDHARSAIGGRQLSAIDVGENEFPRGGRQINLLRAGFPGHLDICSDVVPRTMGIIHQQDVLIKWNSARLALSLRRTGFTVA